MAHKAFYLFIIGIAIISCNAPEARKPLQQKSGSFIESSIQRNKILIEKETQQLKEVMQSNPSKNYIASESGFWYFYNVKDTLNKPTAAFGDQVRFSYSIRDLEGNSIYTQEENGVQDYIVDKTNQSLISGVREGIKLMKEGEIVTFFLPSYKAYGYYGIVDKLGSNIPVITTVHLQSLEKANTN